MKKEKRKMKNECSYSIWILLYGPAQAGWNLLVYWCLLFGIYFFVICLGFGFCDLGFVYLLVLGLWNLFPLSCPGCIPCDSSFLFSLFYFLFFTFPAFVWCPPLSSFLFSIFSFLFFTFSFLLLLLYSYPILSYFLPHHFNINP